MRRPIGLRGTITLSFAVGGLLLSLLLAVGTYLAARHYLVEQREQVALRQTYVDAAVVVDNLRTSGVRVQEDVLGAAGSSADSDLLLERGGRWYTSSLDLGPSAVPPQVVAGVDQGSVTYAWTRVRGRPAVVVGVPLRESGARFYEVSTTDELASTLSTLLVVLLAFAVLGTAAGAAAGRLASARVMAPLDDVAGAAARIAAGGLQTRLPPTSDPDLATIVGSFNSMVEALEERIRRDARFAADVGHELRSPLTTLVASVEVIRRRRDELPERTRRALDLVDGELDRFRRTLEDLLELGRLDAGVRGTVVPLDAAELLAETLAASHRDPGLLHVEGGPVPPVVVADRWQLSRAVVNLLDNADRHGGGATRVRVGVVGDAVRVCVEDAGPGVAPDERTRVFERFVRGGSRGSLPGSGLGLSLVAETAAAYGGRVWVEPASADGGARFCLMLPLQVDAAAPAGAA
ncbi:HAMP domain-containing sensor histidine kinase [Lapillicoccus jejuensis]